MSGEYEVQLDDVPGAEMRVSFETEGGQVVEYSVVLVLATPFGVETIRVYDAAHGFNEMHRYAQADGKQDGVVFAFGTLGEGLRTAIEAIKQCHREMIEGWTSK